jgi:glycine dehydrogenase subunit 1
MGPQGLRETANLCLQKSRYLAEQLCQSERFSMAFDQPTFKEFVIRDAENDVDGLLQTVLDAGYLAGLPLGRWYPQLSDCLLIAVTEKRTKAELDGLVRTLAATSVRQPALR